MKKITLVLLTLSVTFSIVFSQNDREQKIQQARHYYAIAKNFDQKSQFDSASYYYLLAANLYKDINPVNYAIIKLHLADDYIQMLDYAKALKTLQEIKPIFIQKKGEKNKFVGSIYNKLGEIYTQLSKIDSAKIYYFKALDIYKQLYGEYNPLTAGVYSNIGNLYAMFGNYSLAKYYLNLAAGIYSTISGTNSIDYAITINNLAYVYKALGLYDQALNLMKKVIDIFKQTYGPQSPQVAKVLSDIGKIYMDKEENDLAKDYLQQSLDIYIKLYGANSLQAASVYYSLGVLYNQMQDYNTALQFYFAALRIYQGKLPPTHPDIIGLINNIAVVYRTMGNYETSIQYYKNALKALKSVNPDDYRIPIVYTNIAAIFYNLDQTDSALNYYKLAIERFYQNFGKHNPTLIKPLVNLGYVYFKKNNYSKALEYFQKAIIANCPNFNDENFHSNPSLTEYYNGIKLLESFSNKIAALVKLYNKNKNTTYLWLAYKTTVLADSLAQELRQTIISDNDKLTLNLHTLKIYENGITICNMLTKFYPQEKFKFLNKAFYFAERNKAALLVESMNAAKAQKIAGIPDSLLQKEQNLRRLIAYYDNKLAKLEDFSKENIYRSELFKYKNKYHSLIKYFEQHYPKYYEIKYSPNFVEIQKLQNVLDTNQALISYFYGYKNLFVFVIAKDTVAILSSSSKNVADTVLKMYKNIKINSDQAIKKFAHSSFELFKMIFPNDIPKKVKKLVIIPDDILNIVPFEALLQNDTLPQNIRDFAQYPFLIYSYDISYSYSSYLFYTLHYSEVQPVKGFDFLGVAPGFLGNNRPVFKGQKITPLPGSLKEVKEIAQNFADHSLYTKTLLDTTATETNFKHLDLTNFKIIHISTHGLIFSNHPDWSALIFSKEQQPDDGFLFVGEIYNLKIRSSLVTLSACETGLGKISRGEGVIGMSRAFFFAGAQNLLISLWKVSDAATKNLMVQFYKNLLNQYPVINENTRYSQALHKAKLWMLQNGWSHPYYWASFILVGE